MGVFSFSQPDGQKTPYNETLLPYDRIIKCRIPIHMLYVKKPPPNLLVLYTYTPTKNMYVDKLMYNIKWFIEKGGDYIEK